MPEDDEIVEISGFSPKVNKKTLWLETPLGRYCISENHLCSAWEILPALAHATVVQKQKTLLHMDKWNQGVITVV